MSSYLALPIVQSALCLALLPIVLRGHFRSAIHRLFSLYLVALLFYGVFIFLMRSSPNLEQAYYWERWPIGLGPFMAVVFYQFTVRFAGINIKKWVLPSFYAACLAFFLLSRTDLLIAGMQMKPYGYAPIAGPVLPVMGAFVYAVPIMSLLNLLKVSRSAQSAEERNRSVYIVIGMVCFLLGGVFDLLPLVGLPLYPGFIIGNLIFCLLTTTAIVKYHLLDIHIVVRKGMAYFLMTIMLALFYAGAILLFNQLFKETVPLWAHMVLLVLLALILWQFWNRLQRMVDRLFYRERYDFLNALEDFTRESHDITDLDQLSCSLVKLVSRALRASSAELFLPSSSGDFRAVASTDATIPRLTLGSHNPLVLWLKSHSDLLGHQDLALFPSLQSLTARERHELDNTGAELFVPLKTKQGELVGLLLLGKKLSQQPYCQEDRQLVSTVADRMAVELENARLYNLEKLMRRELEKQDEQKTEFLHSVAHELKTPLTAIISSSELLTTEQASTPSQRQRLVQNLVRSAWFMDKRVSELLDIARLQVGDLQLKSQPLEIGVIVEEVASRLLPLFENKEQSLRVEIPDSVSPVKGDRDKIEQILLNLLSNANKFSPTHGNIALWVREFDDRIVVGVTDSAPAITEEEKEKLFDPYYRVGDADEKQRIPGLGLGLAISRKLVELHQGKIWVENEAGKGNTFVFSLPTSEQLTKDGR